MNYKQVNREIRSCKPVHRFCPHLLLIHNCSDCFSHGSISISGTSLSLRLPSLAGETIRIRRLSFREWLLCGFLQDPLAFSSWNCIYFCNLLSQPLSNWVWHSHSLYLSFFFSLSLIVILFHFLWLVLNFGNWWYRFIICVTSRPRLSIIYSTKV